MPTVESSADVCPVLHPDSGPEKPAYVSYARIDELHELAQPVTDSPRELSFLLINHVMELLFRALHVEVGQAREALRRDRAAEACLCIGRGVRAQRLLVDSWDAMTTITPDEFLQFRGVLGGASAAQSYLYRALEFSLGEKNPRMVEEWAPHFERFPVLREELQSPTLYDEALRYLSREGMSLPADVLDRDVTAPYEPHPSVEDAWLAVYQSPAARPEAHRLAEALVELAYQFSLWRANHLLVVERILGSKPGTGGTGGTAWLRTVNEHRFFPELWSARTRL
ncbi:tryptophan 2,3-dioxygenase [Actinomadura chibensis]|uniref:Tryptophan 2,3-dioxygenase n=1 Tax=Actinomadura chibensis TaxID=392828 RepID=A0A5D0NQ01_9ACTN|nr:tryptophan 2,3-dioxygenase family protein [Actinomadura chibensis]TYB46392.1 tryptophan 2,3-dioxygenase [Actinomadura chibensis]